MDEQLIRAILNKEYEYIFQKLQPLFLSNLIGVPSELHDDFLQEYKILCFKIISERNFSQ